MKPSLKNIILFVDDDPDDLEFYGESMMNAHAGLLIREARSGILALEYLRKAKEADELPCLIVLDVNMPVMSGKDTLLEIKKDKVLAEIPVVIFSTASNPREKEYFNEHEVAFFTKPCTFSEMESMTKQLLNYCAFPISKVQHS
ncbi:MAG: response regulator [Flavisolibacter sp.]